MVKKIFKSPQPNQSYRTFDINKVKTNRLKRFKFIKLMLLAEEKKSIHP